MEYASTLVSDFALSVLAALETKSRWHTLLKAVCLSDIEQASCIHHGRK